MGAAASAPSKREKVYCVAWGDGTSYRAALPSMAPSAKALVTMWPARGYASFLPLRGAADEYDWPTMPCGSARAAASPVALGEGGRGAHLARAWVRWGEGRPSRAPRRRGRSGALGQRCGRRRGCPAR